MNSKSVMEVGRLLGNDDKVVNTPANHFDDKNERESYADMHGIASMTGMYIGLYEFMRWTLWKTL